MARTTTAGLLGNFLAITALLLAAVGIGILAAFDPISEVDRAIEIIPKG